MDDRKVRESAFVLVICTESYFRRVEGKRDEEEKEAGEGLGATYEGTLIINELYEQGADNLKFIPVIFEYSARVFIPPPLRQTTYYNLGKKAGYEDLYRRLIGQPKIKKPPLGKIKILEEEKFQPLPKKKVKQTSPAALLLSPIDVKLWDAAKWSATFFMGGEYIPILGIAYRNEAAGRKIFEGWRERFGNIDASDELRIAMIDGPIKGEEDGYSVHISLDPEAFDKKMRYQGMTEGLWVGVMVSRINRMTPQGGLANLAKDLKRILRSTRSMSWPPVWSPKTDESLNPC